MLLAARAYAVVVLLAVAFSTALAAGEKGNKGDKGKGEREPEGRAFKTPELDFILDREKELALTAEQKKKLAAMKEKVEQSREKWRGDPAVQKLAAEFMEAKKSGDEARQGKAKQELREAIEKKSGTTADALLTEFAQILTQEQLVKLRELRQSEGPGMARGLRGGKGGKGDQAAESQKPDPSKGAPKLYEDEK